MTWEPDSDVQGKAAFQRAVQLACAGATVLTPTTRSARALLRAANLKLSENSRAWATPDVLPWGAWLERLWTTAQLGALTTKVLLSQRQSLKLWQEIAASSPVPAGLASVASQAWMLSRQFRLDLNSSEMGLTPETRLFAAWARSYHQRCADKHWTDLYCIADELTALLPKLELPRQLALFGFDFLNPQQSALLDALRGVGVEVIDISSESASGSGHVRLVEADDSEAELRLAARWARVHLEANPEAEISIVVLALDGVRALAEQVFTEILHPEALAGDHGDRAFEISLGRPLAEYSITRSALDILQFASEGLPWAKLSNMLRSPHLGECVSESSGRARLDVEIRRFVRESVTVSELTSAMEKSAPKGTRCAALESRLRRITSLLPQLAGRRPTSAWRDRAAEILRAMGCPGDGPNGRSLNSAEFQQLEKWKELLSEIATLDLISGEMTFSEFVAELQSAARTTQFKPQSSLAPIQVMDEIEAAGVVSGALWVCGATNENWPRSGRPCAMLPLCMQRSAGVPHSDAALDRVASERVMRRLFSSASRVVVSVPHREDDRELRISPLVTNIAHITPEELSLSNLNAWPDSQRGATVSEERNELASAISVSEVHRRGTRLLERQSNCPFSAFAEFRLGAERMDEPADGLKPLDRGNLVDSALQAIWEELRDSFTLANTTADVLREIVTRSVDKAIGEARQKMAVDEWTSRLLQIERGRLIALMDEWLRLEMRRTEPFEVIACQMKVEFELSGLKLKGRIDRLDRQGNEFVVIDYKTGSSAYSGAHWRPPRMQRPQLPTYAAKLMSEGKDVAAVAFAMVNPGGCKFSGYGARKGVLPFGRDMVAAHCDGDYSAHIAKWRPALEALASAFLAGEAQIDPLRWPGTGNATCDSCNLQSICRVAELRPVVDPPEEDEEGGYE